MSFDEKKLKGAFKNPKYTWRTVRGVAKETGINQEIVKNYVINHGDQYIKSSSTNARGEVLFADREVYRSKASPVRRIISAIKNRGG